MLDLKRQHTQLKKELEAAISGVIAKSAFVLGEYVERFEEEFARYCGTRYAVGLNSGTSALYVALRACGAKPGDEVLTSPFTFVANVEAAFLAGMGVRFADVEARTLNLDPEKIEDALSERTKVIMPIHLYGHPADLDRMMEIAGRTGAVVIEDAAHAHGARYKGKIAGGIADAGCFSFYPSKSMGALGEGGMIVTDDEDAARESRLIRHHGDISRYEHAVMGFNFRMEGIQAAALSVKLKHLDEWVKRRRDLAASYSRELAGLPVTLPMELPGCYHSYCLYTVRTKERDALRRWLGERGVQSAVHYPIALHLQKVCEGLGYREGDFPVAEEAAREVLSLPLFPEMTDEELMYAAGAVREFFSGKRKRS